MHTSAILTSVLLLAACTPAPPIDEHMISEGSSAAMSASRLTDSPRHQKWVEVKNGSKTIHTWVVYPERSVQTPVVILIHENRGLNDWARDMAD